MLRIRGAGTGALLALAVAAPAAIAHGGGSLDYSSQIRSIAPADAGLRVEVLDRDDRLLLINDTGERVVVRGYGDEPYIRLGADGTVAVNERSPAHYLNRERDGDVRVPDGADEQRPPRWRVVDRSGRYEWHDHRIHWMGGGRPPAVDDPAQRTKVFDWKLPLSVGERPGAIEGTLLWVGRDEGGPPLAAIAALAAVVLGGIALVLVVRGRRRRTDSGSDATEAW